MTLTQKGIASLSLFLLFCTRRELQHQQVYLFITSSSANASSSGKRKPATAAKTSKKKGEGMDPASVIEEFGTTYGNMMFDEAGISQLTPADSGRCGMLIQKQR